MLFLDVRSLWQRFRRRLLDLAVRGLSDASTATDIPDGSSPPVSTVTVPAAAPLQDFLIIAPGTADRRSIVTQTRKGWPIPNAQSFELSLNDKHHHESERQKHPMAVFRTGMLPHYNCHGFSLASRRTVVSDSDAVRRVLDEDGYREVARADTKPGDLILYVSREDGDIEHTGLVIEPPSPDYFGIPRVVSKWGFGAEVVHLANDCPYDFSTARYYRVME